MDADFKFFPEIFLKRYFDVKIDVFSQFMPFLTEIALRKWFPWQQEKVYPKSYDFEMLPINIVIREKSQKSQENIFRGSRVTKEKPARRVKNTPPPPPIRPYRVKPGFDIIVIVEWCNRDNFIVLVGKF